MAIILFITTSVTICWGLEIVTNELILQPELRSQHEGMKTNLSSRGNRGALMGLICEDFSCSQLRISTYR